VETLGRRVTESHRTYLSLVYFRSHRPLTSWVTALLGVLDSAALHLALSPAAAPIIPARLCLRSGFTCFTRIAQALGVPVPDEADPQAGITLTYADFEEAVARLKQVAFPIGQEPEQAWPHFVGWRMNYERAAYAMTWAVSARRRCGRDRDARARPRCHRCGRRTPRHPGSRAPRRTRRQPAPNA
jgi:hypothetical protein